MGLLFKKFYENYSIINTGLSTKSYENYSIINTELSTKSNGNPTAIIILITCIVMLAFIAFAIYFLNKK